jgi:hypothetical protein
VHFIFRKLAGASCKCTQGGEWGATEPRKLQCARVIFSESNPITREEGTLEQKIFIAGFLLNLKILSLLGTVIWIRGLALCSVVRTMVAFLCKPCRPAKKVKLKRATQTSIA